ncbi:MAG: hypothetical protein HPY44_13555 [Armatimonadetes bacterium]|nr:hypothetical protein [Armatimonadota bacterium]
MLLGLLIKHEDWLTKHGFNPCVAVRELRSRQRVTWTRWLIGIGAVAAGIGPVPMLVSVTAELVAGNAQDHLRPVSCMLLTSGAASLLTLLLVIPSALGLVIEHEKRTLEHVRATPLTSGDVVTGKIIATVDAGLVLLCILVPLQFWAMLLGGPTPGEWLGGVVLLVGLVVWASCLGTAISAISLNTVSAVIRAFVILGLLRVVPFLGMALSTWVVGSEDALGVRGAVFVAVVAALLALPVAYRALARIARYAADCTARLVGALVVSCLFAGLLLAFLLASQTDTRATIIQFLYPPSGMLLGSRYVMGVFSAPDEQSAAPLVWLAALVFSLLGSAFFQSLAAMGYEGQARSRIWRILMFGADTQ